MVSRPPGTPFVFAGAPWTLQMSHHGHLGLSDWRFTCSVGVGFRQPHPQLAAIEGHSLTADRSISAVGI